MPTEGSTGQPGPFPGHRLLDLLHPRPHQTQEPFLRREALATMGASASKWPHGYWTLPENLRATWDPPSRGLEAGATSLGTLEFLLTYLGTDSLLSPWDSQLHPQPLQTPDGAHQAEQLELTDALRTYGTSSLQLPPEGSAAPSEEEANISWRCPCSARQELNVFREFSRQPRLQVHCLHCKPYFECRT
ncbi:hypothetical protein R6Z07F_011670 [Ovis aries]